MVLTIAHRLVFVGVLAAPGMFASDRARIWWIIGVVCAHNILVHLGDPIWFSWMTDLVPRAEMTNYWARRQRVISAGGIVVGLAVAIAFGHFEKTGQIIRGFVLLASAGVVLGVVDALLFCSVPEPTHDHAPSISLRAALLEPFRNQEYRRFLVFRTYWSFAVMVSAPFFQLYLIQEMGFTVLTVQMIRLAQGVGIVMASGRLGKICDTYGFRPVLQLFVSCKFLVPLVYLLVPRIGRPAVLIFMLMSLADGVMNAAGILAFRGVSLKCTPRRNRTMFIAVANFVALGLAGGIAPLISGSLIRPMTRMFAFESGPYVFTGFHVVFLMGVILRLGGLPFAIRLREANSRPVGALIAHLRSERPFWMSPLK